MKRRPSVHPGARGAKLFAEPEAPAAGPTFTANIDGAARGNPGPASYGVMIRNPDGSVAAQLKKYVGRSTNNVAEYYALIAALDYAAAHGIRALRIESDSELLVQQMRGRYKVRSADLRPLFERAKKLAQGLAHFAIEHVPRERNRDADALANQALDAYGVSSDGGKYDSGKRLNEADFTREQRYGLPKRIRARYTGGKLHPFVPLDLPDGAEVELTVEPVGAGKPAEAGRPAKRSE
jgi:ribonuclease HI/predicted DNA-binding antitoxin AbrB/MazE fold protein